MVVKVLDMLKNVNMIRSSGRDWEKFIAAVEEMRAQTPASEKLEFDAKGVYVEYSNRANDIVRVDNIELVLYNANDVCTTLNTVCMLSGRPKIARNVEVEVKSLTVKPLTQKEKDYKALVIEYENNMNKERPFNGVYRITLETWNSPNSINFYGIAKRDAIVEAMMNRIRALTEAGEVIEKIIFTSYRTEIADLILERVADQASTLSERGITLEMRCDNEEEERKLKLRTSIRCRELNAPAKMQLLKNLGKGRVGLLTKVKKRRSNNIELRLKDELVRQYIAILQGINKERKAVFICYNFNDLMPTCDDFVSSGEETCDEDIVEAKKIEISIDDLGICDVCLGIVWHFETFDGKAVGLKKKVTYAGPDGCYSGTRNEVNIAEYIRRSLLSMNVKFNNEALMRDSAKFEADMNSEK